jgi:hypothetical protein
MRSMVEGALNGAPAASPLHHPSGDEQVGLPPAIPAMSGGHGDLLIPPRAGEDQSYSPRGSRCRLLQVAWR